MSRKPRARAGQPHIFEHIYKRTRREMPVTGFKAGKAEDELSGGEVMRLVYQLAKHIVEDCSVSELELLRNGLITSEIACMNELWENTIEFVLDLAHYLVDSGDTGRKLAKEICRSTFSAALVESCDEAPEALRFLGHLAKQFPGALDGKWVFIN